MSKPLALHKAENLDQALLFLSAFAVSGFALGFNLVFKPTLVELLAVLPPLLIVGVMPLYVGYMRGAIEQQSMAERARGWVYLLFGLGSYSITVVVAWIAFGPDPYLKMEMVYPVMALLIFLYAFTNKFVSWLYKTLGFGGIPLRVRAGTTSTVAGIFMSSLG
jgi:hypothetical protein